MPGPAGFFWKDQTKAGVASWLLTGSQRWELTVPASAPAPAQPVPAEGPRFQGVSSGSLLVGPPQPQGPRGGRAGCCQEQAGLSQGPGTAPWLQGGAQRPTRTQRGRQPGLLAYLHHWSAQPWLWAAQGRVIMPTF